ncbi:MAG: hypothetical protein ABR584_08590 [Candidatus Baltobacteraceae bacterium]
MTDQTIEYIYVITDTKGAGRVVGAFYFRMTALPLDSVNPAAIEWLLSTAQRDQLRSL